MVIQAAHILAMRTRSGVMRGALGINTTSCAFGAIAPARVLVDDACRHLYSFSVNDACRPHADLALRRMLAALTQVERTKLGAIFDAKRE